MIYREMYFFFILVTTTLARREKSPCELPQKWHGGWFQSGALEVVSITKSHISSKGECTQAMIDKFIFKDPSKGCSRCVVISEKHSNVLQYKESLCEFDKAGDLLCKRIPGDALLFSLFRRDIVPIPCPLRGPLTFSYNQGSGLCSVPLSTIDSCTSHSRILFKYQACPDVEKSESSEENVECIGDWREGSTRYFVGKLHSRRITSDEDRYRCFAWEKSHNRPRRPNVDYHMALSGDATCNGVTSAYDGSRTLRINKSSNHTRCKLPLWVTQHRKWFALDKGITFGVTDNNTTITITNEMLNLATESRSGRLDNKSTTLTCANIIENKQNRMTFVSYSKTECVYGYVCTVLHRRGDKIIEIQQGSRAVRQKDACSSHYFNPIVSSHATLTVDMPDIEPCPIEGAWTVVDSQCGESITHLKAACDSTKKSIEFISRCDSSNIHKRFTCYGSWKESDITYVIVSAPDKMSNRMCLVGRKITKIHANDDVIQFASNGKYVESENETYSISVHDHSCPRQIVPTSTAINVNLTSYKTCSDFVLSGSISHSENKVLLIAGVLALAMMLLDLR